MPGTDLSDLNRSKIRKYASETPSKPHAEIAEWFSEKFGRKIHRSTVSRILSKQFAHLDDLKKPLSKNTRKRRSHWPILEELLDNWVKALQRTGATITEESLVKRAHMAWNQMKHQNPDAKPPSFSNGWISNVKKRLNITQRAVSGESASVPVEALELMPAIREICGEYSQKDIFNMDESALYYKLGPSKALGAKPVSGPNKSKQRLTMVLCCNADGLEKSDILLLSKAKTKHYLPNSLTVPYLERHKCWWLTNSNAWMNGELMVDWLKRFYNQIGNERRVLLLLDNFSGHTKGLELCKPHQTFEWSFFLPTPHRYFNPLIKELLGSQKLTTDVHW